MLLGTTSTGQWAPVAGQLREAHPNGTDTVMERWTGTAWAPIPSTYDSGWREIVTWAAGVVTAGALLAAWKPATGSAGYIRVRRANGLLQIRIKNLSPTTPNTGGPACTLPAGFGFDSFFSASPISVGGVFISCGPGSQLSEMVLSATSAVVFGEAYTLQGATIPTSLPGTPA
jgi:hypothetical protein